MTPEQRRLIELENKWRNLFAEKPTDPELQDPHLGLENVFSNIGSFVYQPESPEEAAVPKLLCKFRQVDLQGSAVVSKEQFAKNWKEFTQGCLDGLDWNNVFAAGGAVLGCVTPQTENANRGSDIDLFIVGISSDQVANQKVKEIYNLIVQNTKGRGEVIRTNRAITILCAYPFRHVQIILRLYKSPAEVLLGFDIDSCCIGFDGKEVWCQERFKRALTKRYNLANVSRRSITYEQRLLKYSKRGFVVAVPNLDINRVSPTLFNKDPRDVQGLAKLLIYDHRQNNPTSTVPRFRKRKPVDEIDEEGSDYNNDLHIPWGPEWQTDTILGMLNTKNRAKFFASVKRRQAQGQQGPGGQPGGQPGQKPAYNHMLTSNAQQLQQGDFLLWNRSLDNKQVQQPLEWVKDNPAYQDFDNGFRRLMTGSFEPIVDSNWEVDVYKKDVSSLVSYPSPKTEKTEKADKSEKKTTVSSLLSKNQGFSLSEVISSVPAVPPPTQSKMFAFGNEDIPAQLGFTLSKNQERKREREAKIKEESPSATPVAKAKPSPAPSTSTSTSLPSYIPPPTASYMAEVEASSLSLDSFPQPGKLYSFDIPEPSKIDLSSGIGLSSVSHLPSTSNITTTATTTTTSLTSTQTNAPIFPSSHYPAGFSLPSVSVSSVPPRTVATVSSVGSSSSTTTKLLLLIALFGKQGTISQDEKGKLKDLVIQGSPLLLSALEVFEIDQDITELTDTLRRVCRFT